MSRTQLAAVSLVAAIPGGFLVVMLVMTFLNQADNLAASAWAFSIITLLASATAMLMPVGILLFGPKAEKEKTAELDDDQSLEPEEEGEEFLEEEGEALDELESEPDMVVGEGDELSAEPEGETAEFEPEIDEDLFMEDVDQTGEEPELELDEEAPEIDEEKT